MGLQNSLFLLCLIGNENPEQHHIHRQISHSQMNPAKMNPTLTHLCRPVRSTFAPLKPLRDDIALRALSTLRGLRGAPEVPPLCRETQSLGQQMLERWAYNTIQYKFIEV